jgi:hypothetical protein
VTMRFELITSSCSDIMTCAGMMTSEELFDKDDDGDKGVYMHSESREGVCVVLCSVTGVVIDMSGQKMTF